MNQKIYIPASLQKGDKIAIVSPASVVKEEYVYGAMEKIEERGYEPVLMEHALGPSDGSFASDKADRIIDLVDAVTDTSIKAILCARGGYGCCQLVRNFSFSMIANNPKWIIGFSDVSALLALWYKSGIASVHGPMAKHLASHPSDDHSTEELFRILENNGNFDYKISSHPFNHSGKTEGILRGGNFAVLNDLICTPYDILKIKPGDEEVILFLEDINEPIYKVNRMLWHLYLTGTIQNVKGLIFGQFTDYKPDSNFSSMEEMIDFFIRECTFLKDIPIVYNFPTGHTEENLPLTVGSRVSLEVNDNSVMLKTL